MPLFIFAFNRIVFRASEFIKHWYIDSFFNVSGVLIRILEELDGFFAIQASWRRIISAPRKVGFFGVLFGIFKVLSGGILYLALAGVGIATFLAWAMVPPFLILKAAGFDFKW